MNKIRTTEPRVIWNIKCKLGEGTLWVKEHNSIYFVDIKKKKICILNIKNNKKKQIKVNKEVGFLAHVKKNIFILGLQGEIRIQNLKSKKILKSIFTEPNIKLNRTNDGKTDSAGNLWFGTMDNLERKIEKGSLYKLDKNLILTKVDKNYRITNGPAFLDQYNFYHTDSSKKKIYKIKINKNNKIVSKKIFKTFSDKEGVPDGMTLDKNKNLWVAHYHGACISVFNNKAKLIHRIQFPAKNITNCTFGGKNNNELFVTSATKGMNSAELRKYRYSGSLFSVKTNSKGILQKKFVLSDEKKRSLL
ncbi:SMP-30/gluconolactonase/LRE family protein [Pelagibacterales bacterium SAG-MED18]|jgi:sugar lactone lactonase YvrE|nr:SMP-30/gluconolactonase/LRE family protein [Pelagibacterales bacterium SAG-MED18]MBD1158339.1 SMP-30/gluconolactonase/LRE family protein [Pelagibacterales bacterium SAG-MED17]|tara:strand:- start:154 stop:1065 length:912 start_codon:yes stop_codon:yes gene_type:complete